MRVLVCPDKFKGSLTAKEVCFAIEKGLKRFDPSIETNLLPLADGGEGTLDVLESILPTKRINVAVSDPLFRTIDTYYLREGSHAFIEMAKASGLQLLNPAERDPLKTTTYGTGEMIKHALDHGVEEVYLLIGGSATNDGGVGMAKALGFEFVTKSNSAFKSDGASLVDILNITFDKAHPRVGEVRFTVLSDVKNLLLGPNGATFVYGAQKGADEEALTRLEEGLANLSRVMDNGKEHQEGAGAAGGLGYGAISFLNASMQSGIEKIIEIVGLDQKLDETDLVITGEGKLDGQSLEGKVVSGIINASLSKNIPIGIICGISEIEMSTSGLKYLYQVMDLAENEVDAMENAGSYVERLAYQMIQQFK